MPRHSFRLPLFPGLALLCLAAWPLPGAAAAEGAARLAALPPAPVSGPAVELPPDAAGLAPPLEPAAPQPAPDATAPQAAGLPAPVLVDSRAALVRLLPGTARDRAGWAADLEGAFSALHLPATPENYCAAIAVIEQVSDFQADPVIASLPAIVRKEIEARRERYGIPKLVLDAALLLPSPDGRSFKTRIDALRTEKQMNALYEEMVAALPQGRALFGDRNPVRTGGAMQVSFEFAEAHARARAYPYAYRGRLRDEVFTRRGGLYFGVANLLDYPVPYSEPLYRFADFNAGRYSSRNAAFQDAVALLGGQRLDRDGDLLRYEKGRPAAEASATQRALLKAARKLGLSEAEILRDLRQEKYAAFARTPLYQRVYALADAKAGEPLPREAMPRIRLKSPKIHRRLTTEWFAHKVDLRYRSCLARGTSA